MMKVYSFFLSFQQLCKCNNTQAVLCHQKTHCSPTTRIDCGVIFLSAWQYVGGMKVSTKRISTDQNTAALFAFEFFFFFGSAPGFDTKFPMEGLQDVSQRFIQSRSRFFLSQLEDFYFFIFLVDGL